MTHIDRIKLTVRRRRMPGDGELQRPIGLSVECSGPLDIDALRAALQDVANRHEALRLRPESGVTRSPAVELPVVECPDEGSLQRELRGPLERRIDARGTPPFAATLFRRAPGRHVLAIVLNPAGAGSRSTGLLLRDLHSFYVSRTGSPACEPPSSAGSMAERADAGDRPPVAGGPVDHEAPEGQPVEDGVLDFEVPERTGVQAFALARRNRAPSAAVALAAFAVLWCRLTGRTELVAGIPAAGRRDQRSRETIGDLDGILPLRMVIDPARNFHDLIKQARRRLARTRRREGGPPEAIKRPAGRSPLFDVLFTEPRQPAPALECPTNLTMRALDLDPLVPPAALAFGARFGSNGSLRVRYRYTVGFLDEPGVRNWQSVFEYLLDRLSGDPEAALADVVAPPAAPAALHGPVVRVPDRAVHEVFAEHARLRPHRVAVVGKNGRLTYGELSQASAALAAHLGARGVAPGGRVGIALPRSVEATVAILGVMRAGAAAVPLDPSHPRKRLETMIEDGELAMVLCANPSATWLPESVKTEAPPPLPELLRRPAPAAMPVVTGEEIAYITYTSGTSGRPKGIAFPHRALANLIHWETEGYTRELRWLQLASLGFDAAFHEIYSALCGGGSLHICGEEERQDHDLLASIIADQQIQKIILPVSLLHSLASVFQDETEPFGSLLEIAAAGEQLRLSESTVAFLSALPHCRLINNYGPAETHAAASYRFDGPPATWPRYAPIGRALPNMVLRLVDHTGREVPRGATGELVISGVCVAAGYLGQPELTAEKFGEEGSLRGYRSGDQIRLLDDGNLEFRGRGDRQVKIRGIRVELAEVDLALRRLPGIRDVALMVAGEAGDRRIDAYLTVTGEFPDQAAEIRQRLRAELPEAFIPATFTVLDALPTNANGKVSPALLPSPHGELRRHTGTEP